MSSDEEGRPGPPMRGSRLELPMKPSDFFRMSNEQAMQSPTPPGSGEAQSFTFPLTNSTNTTLSAIPQDSSLPPVVQKKASLPSLGPRVPSLQLSDGQVLANPFAKPVLMSPVSERQPHQDGYEEQDDVPASMGLDASRRAMPIPNSAQKPSDFFRLSNEYAMQTPAARAPAAKTFTFSPGGMQSRSNNSNTTTSSMTPRIIGINKVAPEETGTTTPKASAAKKKKKRTNHGIFPQKSMNDYLVEIVYAWWYTLIHLAATLSTLYMCIQYDPGYVAPSFGWTPQRPHDYGCLGMAGVLVLKTLTQIIADVTATGRLRFIVFDILQLREVVELVLYMMDGCTFAETSRTWHHHTFRTSSGWTTFLYEYPALVIQLHVWLKDPTLGMVNLQVYCILVLCLKGWTDLVGYFSNVSCSALHTFFIVVHGSISTLVRIALSAYLSTLLGFWTLYFIGLAYLDGILLQRYFYSYAKDEKVSLEAALVLKYCGAINFADIDNHQAMAAYGDKRRKSIMEAKKMSAVSASGSDAHEDPHALDFHDDPLGDGHCLWQAMWTNVNALNMIFFSFPFSTTHNMRNWWVGYVFSDLKILMENFLGIAAFAVLYSGQRDLLFYVYFGTANVVLLSQVGLLYFLHESVCDYLFDLNIYSTKTIVKFFQAPFAAPDRCCGAAKVGPEPEKETTLVAVPAAVSAVVPPVYPTTPQRSPSPASGQSADGSSSIGLPMPGRQQSAKKEPHTSVDDNSYMPGLMAMAEESSEDEDEDDD